MASWGLLIFGILSLILGIILVALAVFWRVRNVTPTWTTGMITTLIIGIVLIILGFILLGLSYAYWTPTVVVPVAVAPVPAQRVISPMQEYRQRFYEQQAAHEEAQEASRAAYLERPIFDPDTGKTTTVLGLNRKCYGMDVNQLQNLADQYDEYRYTCGDILREKRAEAGLPF